VEQTGQSLKVIEEAVERDRWMSADEAKTFGLIDEVVSQRPAALDLSPKVV
jgi:ATP-dependent Clp protease, protease subunit